MNFIEPNLDCIVGETHKVLINVCCIIAKDIESVLGGMAVEGDHGVSFSVPYSIDIVTLFRI